MMARSLPVVILLAAAGKAFAFVGGAVGYGGQETCIDGYDVDCHGSRPSPPGQAISTENKWGAKAIASTVVAGSVAATGVGLIAAAMHNGAHNEGQPAEALAGHPTTQPPSHADTAPTAAPIVIVQPVSAAPGQPAVGVAETIVSVPVAAPTTVRRLGENTPSRQQGFLSSLAAPKQSAAKAESVPVDEKSFAFFFS